MAYSFRFSYFKTEIQVMGRGLTTAIHIFVHIYEPKITLFCNFAPFL